MRRINTLADLIDTDKIIDLKSTNKDDVIRELVNLIDEKSDYITDKEMVLKEFYKREQIMSTGIGLGIAVPHVKVSGINDFVAAIGRSKKGIEFGAIDEQPVHIFIMIGASDKQAQEFLRVLAKIVLRLKHEEVREAIMDAGSPSEIRDILVKG